MWLLPDEADAEGASLVSSCELFEESKERGLRRKNESPRDASKDGMLVSGYTRTTAHGVATNGKPSKRSVASKIKPGCASLVSILLSRLCLFIDGPVCLSLCLCVCACVSVLVRDCL